ncbi:MAG: beta-ketoacyl synthase N-terminal-like domain-containing protein [Akkermansiaceae bacterium]
MKLITGCISSAISIHGLGVLSALGHDLGAHIRAISSGDTGIRPLSDLLGEKSPYAHFHGAWVEPRGLLNHRKWSPASMAALEVAQQAVSAAGWSSSDLAAAGLVLGTSRGNAAGWLGPWPGRRPFKLMAASNTIHSEPATAVSIEFGIFGPNHVVASGCSAGLDALGLGKMMIDSGQVERVLTVAVDLPLVPLLLENYRSSGLLGSSCKLDPFSSDATGFLPGEGAAAIALSKNESSDLKFLSFANNSDGADPVGVPATGGRTKELLDTAVSSFGNPTAICPHATGTAVQARAERKFLGDAFGGVEASLHLLKPYFGHTIGASGLLESAVLLGFLNEGRLPPNLPGTSGIDRISAPNETRITDGPVFKLAHGMGGHNALAVFQVNS